MVFGIVIGGFIGFIFYIISSKDAEKNILKQEKETLTQKILQLENDKQNLERERKILEEEKQKLMKDILNDFVACHNQTVNTYSRREVLEGCIRDKVTFWKGKLNVASTDSKNKLPFNVGSISRTYAGKYPSESGFFKNPDIDSVLKRILSEDRKQELEERFQVQGPIKEKNGIIFVSGCKAHFCGSDDACLWIDKNRNNMYIGITIEGNYEVYYLYKDQIPAEMKNKCPSELF